MGALSDCFKQIGDAIRYKLGSDVLMAPVDMPTYISQIPTVDHRKTSRYYFEDVTNQMFGSDVIQFYCTPFEVKKFIPNENTILLCGYRDNYTHTIYKETFVLEPPFYRTRTLDLKIESTYYNIGDYFSIKNSIDNSYDFYVVPSNCKKVETTTGSGIYICYPLFKLKKTGYVGWEVTTDFLVNPKLYDYFNVGTESTVKIITYQNGYLYLSNGKYLPLTGNGENTFLIDNESIDIHFNYYSYDTENNVYYKSSKLIFSSSNPGNVTTSTEHFPVEQGTEILKDNVNEENNIIFYCSQGTLFSQKNNQDMEFENYIDFEDDIEPSTTYSDKEYIEKSTRYNQIFYYQDKIFLLRYLYKLRREDQEDIWFNYYYKVYEVKQEQEV